MSAKAKPNGNEKSIESKILYPKINVLCEPQLGKRGLYPSLSNKSDKSFKSMMNFISYCDGKNSISEIANLCNIDNAEAINYYETLRQVNLIEIESKIYK